MSKITVTVSGIINDLNNGLSRKEIKEKYNLNGEQMKQLFSNPKLKGKKARKAVGELVIIDDTEIVYENVKSSMTFQHISQEDVENAVEVATL